MKQFIQKCVLFFVSYFLLISTFLFGNIKKLTFKTGTFVETTNTVYLRMHY